MQISFERQILEGLGNTDMLSAYVRAAVADRGDGVKVNGALWPHLTPPAKIGGVARALVKMGLLVPAGAGVYHVVTGKGATVERSHGESGATEQQQINEAPAKAIEGKQAGDSGESEARAEQEQQASEDEAADQQLSSAEQGMRDIDALESLLDGMATRQIIVNPEEITTEERARELARRSWEGMPDPVKARVDYDFEEYWKASAGRFRRDAAS